MEKWEKGPLRGSPSAEGRRGNLSLQGIYLETRGGEKRKNIMTRFFKEEIAGLAQFLQRYAGETIIVLAATLFLTLDRYHVIKNGDFSTFLFYAAFPILTILIVLRRNPLNFGLNFGSPRVWLKYVLVTCLISAAVLYAASFVPSLQKYYKQDNFNFVHYFLVNCLSLCAIEYMFRGFLLFGLKDKFKEGSILIQMIPFVLLHLGKPELETISCLFTGILFGYIAYRGKSFWPAFIIHLFINVYFVWLINR
jgi:CAAX amino terminal protease family.